MKKICVYCGSNPGITPEYLEAASHLAQALAKRNIGLVYGGAKIGLMGKIADTMLENGAEVSGVIPQFLAEKEVAHQGLTELKIVKSMHERKSLMAELSDGFIALPGGLGTLEELFEVLTWSQLGFHRKPCALLNVEQYFDHLRLFLQHAVAQEFIREPHYKMLLVEKEPDKLLDSMLAYEATATSKWIHSGQRA